MNILTELTQQQEQIANQIGFICGIICAILLVLAVIAGAVYFLIMTIKAEEKRKAYIRSLNEHDKAVIAHYNAISALPMRRKKQ